MLNKMSAAGRFVRLAVCLLLSFFSFFGLPVPGQEAVPGGPVSGRVLVIPVAQDVEPGLAFFIKRMIRWAENQKVAALVLEINSNGGLVTAAQEIKDALLQSKIRTIAFINKRAISAAALIAISCEKIYMAPGADLGAATPFSLIGGGVKAAEQKFVSAFRAEFESTAEARNRPAKLAGAMVDTDHDTVDGLVQRGKILTFTSETALKHGYCDGIVPDVEAVLRRANIVPEPLERAVPTSSEELARWLTGPNISVLLFTVGFWCLVLEFLVFGWGFLGWIGVVCLALFFGGHLFAHLAGIEAIILFCLGSILLLIEIFLIPGFGVTGVSGLLSIAFSIVMVFGGIYPAALALAKIMSLSLFIVLFLYHLGPQMKLFDRFILKQRMSDEEGFVAVDLNAFDKLVNLEGVTVSPCRPAGIVRIGGEKYEVVSDGEFIEREQRIVVIKVEGTKIVVRNLSS